LRTHFINILFTRVIGSNEPDDRKQDDNNSGLLRNYYLTAQVHYHQRGAGSCRYKLGVSEVSGSVYHIMMNLMKNIIVNFQIHLNTLRFAQSILNEQMQMEIASVSNRQPPNLCMKNKQSI
jgi:hypothetical protein